MVLSGECKICNKTCEAIYFQQNFECWTSGNDYIDKFIQSTQISAHYNAKKALEWIPYDKFYGIEYVEISKVYVANWIDGPLHKWNNKNFNWERNQNVLVMLKHLSNLKDIASGVENKSILLYGITQEPETKNYMMVLNYICKKCNYKCKTIHFQQIFKNWTSGNNNIDKFIRDTQLSAHDISDALEWIPYDRLDNIEYIAKGGFAKVYKAYWSSKSRFIALKILNNSKNITLEFMNEIMLHYKVDVSDKIIKFYGITQEPETKNYGMVLDYAENGSLRNFLNMNQCKLDWYDKFKYLWIIAYGLSFIHRNELIHRDLHIGNILHTGNDVKITDVGLCKPADYFVSENTRDKIYGNLPYVAPEILRGKNYTKAADIYSFGIVMYEVISELSPYHDLSHEGNLAIKICQGLRPRFNIKVPELIIHLIKRCLDANPSERPTAYEIYKILRSWCDNRVTEIQKQIKESEEINKLATDGMSSTSLGFLHETNSEAIYTSRLLSFDNLPKAKNSEAIYTSRLLSFDNLPKAKNSDDYYKYKDNIISVEFSGIVK
ncbi:Tpk1p [Rhizophagus irregularis DAOM 197198w]|uniref:Tpk1p n=1 Tax=Rhizophagus irregularis (strain DAOM 197198w) TaxID=1432141 RepID=A0A015JUJ5_RHIIW|nr:Tpk1p [Rhizophagus irregularis DAOM 197198w]